MSFRILPLLVIALLAPGCQQLAAKDPDSRLEQVEQVSNGDSFILSSGEEVRLCGIAAPDPTQALGKQSKASLQKLLDQVQGEAIIWGNEKDQHGRTIAEVFIKAPTKAQPEQEISLNGVQLQTGMAALDEQQAQKCPNYSVMVMEQQQAQASRAGVWASRNQQKP